MGPWATWVCFQDKIKNASTEAEKKTYRANRDAHYPNGDPMNPQPTEPTTAAEPDPAELGGELDLG